MKDEWNVFVNSDFLIWGPSGERSLVLSRYGVRKTAELKRSFEFAIWKGEDGGWDRQLFPEHVKTMKDKKVYAITIWRLES